RADPDGLADPPEASRAVVDAAPASIRPGGRRTPVWALPEDRYLVAPSVRDVLRAVDGTLIDGDPQLLSREVLRVVMSGMSMVNVLPRLHESAILVVAADRT